MDARRIDTVIGGEHLSILTGPTLFGYIVDILLFGVLSFQIYFYSAVFKKDLPLVKAAIYIVYAIDFIQTASSMKDLYTLACIEPSSEDVMFQTPRDYHAFGKTWFNVTLSTSLVILLVQWLYAYRIYIVCRCIFSLGAIATLSSLQLVVGAWSSMFFMRMASTPRFQWPDIAASDAGYDANILVGLSMASVLQATELPSFKLWGPINITSSTLIAICMIYSLKLMPGKKDKNSASTGFSRTYVTLVIQLFMKTGVLPTIVMIFYTAASFQRNEPFFMLAGLPLGKLYSVSVMAMFNGPRKIQGQVPSRIPSSFFSSATSLDCVLPFTQAEFLHTTMYQRTSTTLISATVRGRQIPQSLIRRVPHARLLSTTRYSLPTSPSTKYANATYNLSIKPEQSKVPKAPLLGVYARPEFVLSHGKGSYVWDTEGRKYLDFSAGIAVNSLGHADEGVLKVINEQASKIIHASNVYHNEWSPQLASLLVSTTQREGGLGYAPGSQSASSPDGLQVFFSNSGTEANEGALKIARKVGKERWAQKHNKTWDAPECTKTGIVCFENAFHGRSMGALSVTTNPKYQAPFAPLVPNVSCGKLSDVQALKTLVTEDTCAVIVEPIQGEGGIYPAETEWLIQLRKRCDEVGAVLIFDEIQCGLYRTGTLWAHSSLPVEAHPDMLTMAKPLANGYPIGAILLRDSVGSTMTPGTHGTTFGGSPLACAVGYHVFSRLSDPAMAAQISDISSYLTQRLQLLTQWFPQHLEPTVRGRGLILGLGFKDPEAPGKVVGLARERGVFVLTAGKNAVRLVPSLNIGKEEVDLAVDVLEGALSVL
ncbi:hypothetical protein NP233_g9446 [Leucocoprinus birnbaumii]|uniref:acetylornithine transaminase n=1 Tax=Leucocoprinus birnbaumii TaxID=56174 RepID=A0AAD5VKF3_9AGAR|nr:hypothetical protein NP233_g9446 [Leucocoprinus birnbaumii]